MRVNRTFPCLPLLPGPGGMRVVLGALAILAVGLGGCAQKRPPVAFETEPWKFANRDGTKLVTPHYEIFTTLRDEVLVNALPDFVEASYDQYQNLVPAGHRHEERMRIYLFASRPEWEAFTRSYTGARSDVFLKIRNGGYSENGVSVIQYVAHQVTFPLFAHEGFHQYAHFHLHEEVPAWINEGLAVYSEGQRWADNRLREFDPWFNPLRRNDIADAIIADRLHPLAKLLRTHAGAVINESSREVSSYYAQVWALVLFLKEGQQGKYAADFQRLLDHLDEEDLARVAEPGAITAPAASEFSLGEALFRTFISNDLDQVEREYRSFVTERFIGGS